MLADISLTRFKRPDEEFRISWDFSNDLETGDTLAAQQVKAYEEVAGTDVTSTLIENAEIVSNAIRAQVQAGSDGKDYLIRFQATSTQGDKWQRIVRVRVRA